MEILLLLLIVLLSFIAYSLDKLQRTLVADRAAIRSSLSTSLNPLFSEDEISSQRGLSERWQKSVESYFDDLRRIEKEEIKRHQRSGRDKSEFSPSEHLKDTIQRLTVAFHRRDASQVRLRRMIEANISILNGRSITEVSDEFFSQKDEKSFGSPPVQVVSEKFISAVHGEEIKREYDDGLLHSAQTWQERWDTILEDSGP